MLDTGVQMLLLVGPTVPLPASHDLIDAVRAVEVENRDSDRDGFQMEFGLGPGMVAEYGLLADGALEAGSRVILVIIFQGTPQVLIDGIIVDHQVTPSNVPGETRLRVSGVDVSVMMDLEEKSETFSDQSDSMIVTQILGKYAQYGLTPTVAPTADVPIQTRRITTQQGTDFAFVRERAQKNGYLFYIEPTNVPGVNTAYFGPDLRVSLPQPALSMNMGSYTNVDEPLYFRYDSLAPAEPVITILQADTGIPITIPAPGLAAATLSSSPAKTLRKTIARDVAHLSAAEALVRALAEAAQGSDAVTVTGEVDTVRYGGILRARRLVGVRGVGRGYGGFYYVRQVTHRIRRGEYKQSFTLVREGRGTTTPAVVP